MGAVLEEPERARSARGGSSIYGYMYICLCIYIYVYIYIYNVILQGGSSLARQLISYNIVHQRKSCERPQVASIFVRTAMHARLLAASRPCQEVCDGRHLES